MIPMKNLTRYIPNTLTCISLLFGFYAAIAGITGQYFVAMMAILLASVFDFCDGLAARLLKAYSAMGKELDSLADMISFGVAPGMMLFGYLDHILHSLSWHTSLVCKSFLLVAFIVPVFSGLRLAKFNIDERQKSSFLGLPVPAHAILWSSLIVVMSNDVHATLCVFPQVVGLLTAIPPVVLLIVISVLVVLTSFLLVSEIPMFSLKITSFAWKANQVPALFLCSGIVLILLFGITGIAATIMLYIFIGLLAKRT